MSGKAHAGCQEGKTGQGGSRGLVRGPGFTLGQRPRCLRPGLQQQACWDSETESWGFADGFEREESRLTNLRRWKDGAATYKCREDCRRKWCLLDVGIQVETLSSRRDTGLWFRGHAWAAGGNTWDSFRGILMQIRPSIPMCSQGCKSLE